MSNMVAPSPDTVADYLNCGVAPYLHSALISPEALAHIKQLAEMLPAALTSFFGFECLLGAREGVADFLVCASADDTGRDTLSGKLDGHRIPAAFGSSSDWRRVQQFAALWNDPSSPVFERVHNIWLEFDIDGPQHDVPQPSVFLGTNFLRAELDCDWLLESALPILNGETLHTDAKALLRHCIESLPRGAQIFQVGRMLARTSPATRLCARGIPTTELLPYLLKVGWEGETADVEDQIENLSRNAERIDLDFDVDIAVMSKLGFECYPALDRARLADFIGHFVSAGLCVEEKAQQLGRWCGLAHQSAPPSSGWPSGLQTASSLLGGRFHSTFIRWLHHVKAVYQAGFTPQAKAYLAVKHLWLSPVLLKDVLNGVRPEALGSTPGKLGACA